MMDRTRRQTTDRPWLLDLFCGAGGAGEGYRRAGFHVVGVDLDPKPLRHNPHESYQGDALAVLDTLLAGRKWQKYRLSDFDAIHASPPCQHYSSISKGMGYANRHPDLVGVTRERLQAAQLPWMMENVVGAPFLYAVLICGTQLSGLRVYRHRLFETSHLMFSPGPCNHKRYKPIGVYGQTLWDSSKRSTQRKRGPRKGEWRPRIATTAEGQSAMGIDWMPQEYLTQAIPPAYTEWLGRQLLAVVVAERGIA